MLEHLETLFKEQEIFSFDTKDNRIMCFPHIINIAVQHVLKRMSKVEAPDNEDDSEDLIKSRMQMRVVDLDRHSKLLVHKTLSTASAKLS